MWRIMMKIDRGLLVVVVATTIAAWPFLTRGSLPTGTDAEIHIFRAAQIEQAITEGEFYPRWAPDFYFGNGYPIFNYYAPSAYHVAAYFSLATGMGVVAGTKFVLLIAAYLGAGGMYYFVRNRWGMDEGMVASVAWAFSSYILFLEPHARGEVAETLAIGISPWLFWSFDRVRLNGWGLHVPVAAIILAALVFSHPLTALVAYGFLLIFLLWEFFVTPLLERESAKKITGETLLSVAVAVGLGLGISAIYWLPAGLEREAGRMDFYGHGHYDFRRHFIALEQLIAPPLWTDTGAAFPEFRFSMGTVHFLLGILGSMTVFHSRLRRSDTLLFTLALCGAMYMMTSASQGVWEMIGPMRYFQFPMRFLGTAALALVPLCGMALRWFRLLGWKKLAVVAPGACVLGIIWFALPLTYPPKWEEFGPISRSRYHAEELQGKWLGTTCCHDFLPATVEFVPSSEAVITSQYLSGREMIEKFDGDALPEAASVTLLESGPEYDRLRVDSPEGFSLKLFRFYFPGWRAFVDGEEIDIEVTKPDGRMLMQIPIGEHELTIELTETPPRRMARAVTLISVVGWAGVMVVFSGSKRNLGKLVVAQMGSVTMRVALTAVLIGVGAKIVADEQGWLRHHSAGRVVTTAENRIFARVENEIELIAFDGETIRVGAEDKISVVLYWRAEREPTRNYQVYVHLRDKAGKLWGQSDKVNPSSFPTTRWSTQKYVRDAHVISVDALTPKGEYQIFVGLWDHKTGERFLAFDERDWLLGESVEIPITINVDE